MQYFFIGANMRGVEPKCGVWRQNDEVTEAGRRFRWAWKSFCKSGGSEVIFVGIMVPLHPLPHFALCFLPIKCH